MKLMNVIKEFNVRLWIFLYCATNLHKQHPSCLPEAGGRQVVLVALVAGVSLRFGV